MQPQRVFHAVLVPFPITPLAIVGYFIHKLAGEITEQTAVCYHFRHNSTNAGKPIAGFCVLHLFGDQLYKRLRQKLSELPKIPNRETLIRLANYMVAPKKDTGSQDVARFIRQLNREWESPKPVLETAANYLMYCIENGKDPFITGLPDLAALDSDGSIARLYESILSFCSQFFSSLLHRTESIVHLSSQLLLTLPSYEDEKDPQSPIIGHRRVSLEEGRIWELVGRHIGIIIGGPSGSGKSTITATLVDEMCNTVFSYRSRGGCEGLHLSIEYLNLDLGTPTVDAIANMAAGDKEGLASVKREWTKELALEALDIFDRTKRRVNIVVADLPGQITNFTHLAALPADAGIIITKDWDMMSSWTGFLSKSGKILLAQARTLLPQEGLESAVKSYHQGRILSGRVSGLDRIVRSWDPFISTLAKVLLFDLLPSLVAQREHTIQNL